MAHIAGHAGRPVRSGGGSVRAPLVQTETLIAKVPLSGGDDTPGGLAAWQNPTGADVVVGAYLVKVASASGASCVIDVGVAGDGTTVSDTLLDGLDLGSGSSPAAPHVLDTDADAGTNGSFSRLVRLDEWVTASTVAGTSGGVQGTLIVEYSAAQE